MWPAQQLLHGLYHKQILTSKNNSSAAPKSQNQISAGNSTTYHTSYVAMVCNQKAASQQKIHVTNLLIH